jgi:hypothetical protein
MTNSVKRAVPWMYLRPSLSFARVAAARTNPGVEVRRNFDFGTGLQRPVKSLSVGSQKLPGSVNGSV